MGIKTVATVFELPSKLGTLQRVEYEPRRERPYEGLLTAEGCRKGVCARYRVWVHSRDGRRWVIEGFRRMRVADWGGCISLEVADALWELAGRYAVGVWYEYHHTCVGVIGMCNQVLDKKECGVIINGVRLSMPYYCRSASECIERILEDYRSEVERMKDPPQLSSHNPADELLRKYPELEAFGAEWVKAWAPHARERLAEIAEVMRKYPWMAEVAKKRPVSNPNPYAVEAYAAVDSSEVCLFLASRAYCARGGTVRAVPLELLCEYKEEVKKRVYRPKGLLTFTAVGKEYVKIL